MAEVEFTVSGTSLTQYADRLNNLGPVLDKIGVHTEGLTRQALIRGQTIGGTPLAPLSPNTIAEKQLRGKARGILRRDGALLASIAFARTSATEVQVGTNLEYAPWVILGTRPYSISGSPLRFYTAQGWRSAYQVNHPGLPQRNIFEGFQAKVAPFATAAIDAYLSGQ